jgi:hypothetical protein
MVCNLVAMAHFPVAMIHSLDSMFGCLAAVVRFSAAISGLPAAMALHLVAVVGLSAAMAGLPVVAMAGLPAEQWAAMVGAPVAMEHCAIAVDRLFAAMTV